MPAPASEWFHSHSRRIADGFLGSRLSNSHSGAYSHSRRTAQRAWQRRALDLWRYLSVLIAVSAIGADAVLYSFWNFKLDTTPIFYFLSSPSAALASVSPWFVAGAVAVVLAVAAVIDYVLTLLWHRPELSSPTTGKAKARDFGLMLLLTAALFIPIRGGFTVATMNPSAAYFSKEARLNHIAVNPLFSLLYSATHSSDFSDSFAYFTPGEAEAILGRHSAGDTCATATPLLKTARPDIYIIILESFSAHLLPSLGGEPVALRLDSIARQGVLFSNFYASSFRTDRAIPAIVSGFPAQPTTSVMKFVDKTEHLPSLARVLADSAGYRTEYYYGGDINFVNQRAFLLSGGYDKVLCDKDFPLSQRLSKWGAHDDVLLRRTWADIAADSSRGPAFRVIQTSSSHEPFEVPYSNPRYLTRGRMPLRSPIRA